MRNILLGALLATTTAIGVATPAFAQNRAPFTGPHIEALAGYDRLGNSGRDSIDGFLYGVGLGYDVQVGGAIAGIEGEVSDSTARQRDANVFQVGDQFNYDTGRDLYIGGRLGVAARPGTLLYLKGGYTNTRIKSRYITSGNGFTTTTGFNTNLDGYRIGAGVEQKFNLFGPSGFIKAEYRYSNYRNASVDSVNDKIDLDRHQVLAGVGIRF